MTNQEKKKFLAQYRWNEEEIRRLREELSRWHNQTGHLASCSGEMGENLTEEQTLNCVGKMMELERDMAFQLGEKVRLRRLIGQAIEQVEEGSLRQILRLRYIEGCKWEEIGERMSYDVRWVRRLHNKALEKMELESWAQPLAG